MIFDLEAISKLLVDLALLTIPVIAVYVILYLKSKIATLEAGLDDGAKWAFENLISTLVYAAEQIYKSGEGAKKKEYVLDMATRWLKDRGFTIDLKAVEALIEAEVKRSFPKA